MGSNVNYKELAIKELRTLKDIEKSICLGEKRIKDIDFLCSGRAYTIGSGIQKSNDNGTEDFVITLIGEKERIEYQIAVNKLNLSMINSVLSKMTDDENTVLNFAYIDNKPHKMERLAQSMYCSLDKAYSKRNAALKKYILLRFGAEY